MTADNSSAQDNQAALAGAVQAAQAGDLPGAKTLAEAALKTTTAAHEATPFHAFLGMVTARLGDFDQAIQNLQAAHKGAPNDITIACNLISILMDQGHQEAALQVASPDLAAQDESLRVARYRAFLAQNLELFPEAISAYEQILVKTPKDFECWNNLGNARAGVEDFEGAVEALENALGLDPKPAPTRMNLANALQSLDRLDEAEQILLQLTEEYPQDSNPAYQLYVLHKVQGRQDDAIGQLEKAAALEPDNPDIQLKLGIEYGVARDTERAERAYRRTLELDPLELGAYLGLAIQYEHTNRDDMFAPLLEQARQSGVAQDNLAFVEALELRRLKKFDEALEKLSDVPPDQEPIRTAHIRATLLERLERTDEAFAAYSEANRLMQEGPTDPLDRAAEHRGAVASEISALTPDWRDNWSVPAGNALDSARADPVFLVGFPRSGTTLLDTILMGHPDAVVMEEQPPLNNVEQHIGGLAAISGLDEPGISAARALYFEEVDKVAQVAPGQTLIDKSPLFLYRLPLIRRLFPNAKIILALRHPCDVVLSCFMSNFRLNSAMSNFLRLEDAADFYDVCFTHWSRSRGLFPEHIHEVRYEALIDDTEGVVRPLIDWLGLEWDPAALDHTRTARNRGLITTASYSQVVEPIYRRASGRWLRYREHLAPVLPRLAPWIEEFGYAEDG